MNLNLILFQAYIFFFKQYQYGEMESYIESIFFFETINEV